jgi:hypothetical protein
MYWTLIGLICGVTAANAIGARSVIKGFDAIFSGDKKELRRQIKLTQYMVTLDITFIGVMIILIVKH